MRCLFDGLVRRVSGLNPEGRRNDGSCKGGPDCCATVANYVLHNGEEWAVGEVNGIYNLLPLNSNRKVAIGETISAYWEEY